VGDAGKEYLRTIDLQENAIRRAANAGREQNESTVASGMILGSVTDAMTEVAQLHDDVNFSLAEQIPYQEELNNIATTRTGLEASLTKEKAEAEKLAKNLAWAEKHGFDGAVEAYKQKIKENEQRQTALEIEGKDLDYAEKKFTTLSANKAALEKTKEIQEGINELFGVSLKDVEKYGKKFNQFISNPWLIVLGTIGAVGTILNKFLIGPIKDSIKFQKELGVGAGHAWDLGIATKEAAAGGFMYGESLEDAVARSQALVSQWGVINKETMNSLKIVGDLERDYGISAESSATLAQLMESTSSSTKDVLLADMGKEMKSVQKLGIPVGKLMEDVATDTDFFAGYMKDGGKNIIQAAAFAKKLGMSMSTISGAAESLLNWEESINSEMEASVLLGRSVNFERARELAFAGDLEGMQKAIMEQVGSEADFMKMNVMQRQALAQAAGLSLTDLTKMVAAEEKLMNMSFEERKSLEKRNKMTENLQKIFNGVVDLFRTWYGRLLTPINKLFQKLFGGAVDLGTEMLNIDGIIKSIKDYLEPIVSDVVKWFENLDVQAMKDIAKSAWDAVLAIKEGVKWLLEHKKTLILIASMWALNKLGLMSFVLEGTKALGKMILKMWALKTAKDAVDAPSPKAVTGGGLTSFLGNPAGLLKSAGAMLIISASIWVLAKSLQEFADVSWTSMGKGIVTLAVLTAAMFGLGALLTGPGALIFGAGVLGFIALGGAMAILGVGLMSVGKGA
ncbi:MAG: hypothetical protein VYE59_02015, partial [Candidatus Thermoplasmatota archaeon]|nr:hypothetical protein [Candidatus Thermoplasmatota archaeon]